ncbi:MAG: hypothetical protein ACI4IG_06235 [Eubacterium sp.]
MSISKSLLLILEKYPGKIIIDENIEKQPEGNRGVYGLFVLKDNVEECAYIGKSEIVSSRITNHLYRIIDGDHAVSKLNDAFNDENSKIICKFLEPVKYEFDNYYKDAQRLASCECYWIDEKQKTDQCLEQVPEGKRPNIDWWNKQKKLNDQ